MAPPRLPIWIVSALSILTSLGAGALEVPGINGHMTDPLGKLSSESKTQIESQLTKIQEDTHIDVAGWITNAPPEQAEALGSEAFQRWSIGKEWDNGVFLLFPAVGRVHVIQNRAKPELTAPEADQLARADVPTDPLPRRVERVAAEARTLVMPKTQKQVRPWGTNRPRRGRVYLALTLVIAMVGSGLSFRRARRSTTVVPPPPEPAQGDGAQALRAGQDPGVGPRALE